MSDFKVGDKVRFIRNNTNGGAQFGHKGYETEVIDVHNYGVIVAKGALGCGINPNAYAKDLELITAHPAKFKIGDIVNHTRVRPDEAGKIDYDNGDGTYQVVWPEPLGESRDSANFLRLAPAAPAQHAIVALIESGQPKPAIRPFVHADIAAATKEAERLAGLHPGQKFAVYQLVTARIGTVSVAEA